MNSLRFRLILGVSLVALVPLLVAMVLLAQRIQATVRAQADDRLAAALGMTGARLAEDGRRLDERLGLLGRDPSLRRLYLLRPGGGRDLDEYLAEKRFLLGLDFLAVADTTGRVIADGSTAPSAAASALPAWMAGPPLAPGRYGLHLAALEDSSALAMTASAPIPYRNQPAGEVRGGVILDAAFLDRLKRTSGVELVLRDPTGRAVASTIQPSPPGPGPEAGTVLPEAGWSRGSVTLAVGSGPHGSIIGLVSTAAADETVAALRTTSVLLGLLGVGIAIVLGVAWSWQVSRPVERLARFSERIAHGDWEEPLEIRSVRELETLVDALDRMRRDLHAYRARLVASERHAAWSQMARKVAHEVKNPLTPIAISIADLKRSFEQGRPDFPQILDQAVRTIGEEIETLKRLLQEFSEFGRLPAAEFGTCRAGQLLADLGALYVREVADGRLALEPPPEERDFTADRAQLRQALVNLVKNGLEALDGKGRVTVSAAFTGDAATFAVRDDGPGLDAAQRARIFVPEFTTKTGGSGLGLAIVERIVTDHGGTIAVESEAGRGTLFRISLPLSRETV